MQQRLRKPSYTFMHVILNQCIRGRMAQTMFAVFAHSTLRIVFYLVGLSMTASSLTRTDSPSPLAAFVALLLLLLANLAGELLTYGLYRTLSPLVLNRASSIKELFSGFRGNNRRALKAALAFTLLNTAALLALGIAAAQWIAARGAAEADLQTGRTLLLAALAFILLVCALTLPFTFSYLIILTKDGVGIREAFAVSWKLLRHQLFHFIGFVLYAGGSDLVAAVFFQLLLFILPSGEAAGASVQLLGTLASFAGILAQYRTMSRVYLAVCIYFFCEAGILHPHGGKEAEQ